MSQKINGLSDFQPENLRAPMANVLDALQAARRIALAVDAEANGPRQHYVRAVVETDGAGARVRPLPSQDSSLVSGLARADVLIVRPPHAPAAAAGSMVDVLPLDF